MDGTREQGAPTAAPPRPDRVFVVLAAVAITVLLAVLLSDGGRPEQVGASATTATSARRATTTAPSTSSTTATTASTSSTTATTAPPTTSAPPVTVAPETVPPVEAAAEPPPPVNPGPPIPGPSGGGGALCIGDSVMLGASYRNALAGTCGLVDATVSRQMRAADDAANAYFAQAGSFPPSVVVALGNNGYTSAAEIDDLLAVLAGVPRVVLVTIQLNQSRAWQDSVNAEIRAAAARYPTQVVLADWEYYSSGHPEWFGPDGIHISDNAEGAAAYGAVVASVV